jgi:hypothetical protein
VTLNSGDTIPLAGESLHPVGEFHWKSARFGDFKDDRTVRETGQEKELFPASLAAFIVNGARR